MHIIRKDPSTELEFDIFRAPAQKWFAIRASGKLPTIDDMLKGADPLVENRIVSTITPEPFGVRYRTVGPVVEALYGKPMAGNSIDELYNDWFRKRIYEGYKTAVKECLPVYVQRGVNTAVLRIGYHSLLLPCGTDTVTDMISYVIPNDPNIRTRSDWEMAVKETPWF